KFILKSLFNLARAKGIKVIVVTFQPTGAWKDWRPLFNKFKTTDVAIWHELSILSLVLVDGMKEHFPAPSALVMKEQLAKLMWDPQVGAMQVRRRLPLKLPLASMSAVYQYLIKPASFLEPGSGEVPEPGEVDQWSVTFSKDQLRQLEKLAEAARLLDGDSEKKEVV